MTPRWKPLPLCDVLNLAIVGKLKAQGRMDWRHYHSVALFLKKWDCPTLSRLYILRAGVKCGDGMNPLSVFLIGVELQCLTTCSIALDAPARKWKGTRVNSGMKGFNMLNPAYWPLVLHRLVPVHYYWALQRTFSDPGDVLTPGARFTELLEEARKEQ